MAQYIAREALMKNFCGYDLTKCVKYGNKDAGQRHDSYSTMMMYEIADEIIDAPAADVAPVRHGRWIIDGVYVVCSICNRLTLSPIVKQLPTFTYCPNCGARMDLEVTENGKK